jgi:hypothetical protein
MFNVARKIKITGKIWRAVNHDGSCGKNAVKANLPVINLSDRSTLILSLFVQEYIIFIRTILRNFITYFHKRFTLLIPVTNNKGVL